jgi:hypothetical protein
MLQSYAHKVPTLARPPNFYADQEKRVRAALLILAALF